jgi:hypothetical protein
MAVTPTSLERLSPEHRAEVEKGSGVSPEMVEGRYFTVTTAETRTLGFSKEQAGAGWVVRLSFPTGEVSYQLKRDRPRVVEEDNKLKAVKYETPSGHPCIVDVHPANVARLLDVSEDLWIVEGAKKGDCVASRGRLALVLAGVWNWGKKREEGGVKYGRPELLPDWYAIPLEGRRVFIAFDGDYREKRGVALAIMRLAERLTEQGAHVYIIGLPGGETSPGKGLDTSPGKGLDDYVVAGGDLEELVAAAKPYQACDFTPYVATQDQRVWNIVATVEERMGLDTWKGKAAKTDHSLLRALLELAMERGKFVEGPHVSVLVSTRGLQQRAGIGSRTTLTKADRRLQERGYIGKEPGDPGQGKANIYRINPTKLNHYIGEDIKGPPREPMTGSVLESYVPHLRHGGAVAPPSREELLPERGPNSPMSALGKNTELALHRLHSWGGTATVRDLAQACGVGDPSTLRKRVLEGLAEVGIVELDKKGTHRAKVRLASDWRERLDTCPEMDGELSAAIRQAVRHREAREAFYYPP